MKFEELANELDDIALELKHASSTIQSDAPAALSEVGI